MTIGEAQWEIRTRFVGGVYGQLVSGILWLTSAGLAVWRGHVLPSSCWWPADFLFFQRPSC
jgi:hypothetical protein